MTAIDGIAYFQEKFAEESSKQTPNHKAAQAYAKAIEALTFMAIITHDVTETVANRNE